MYKEYFARLVRYLRSLGADRNCGPIGAEDIAQEVFADALIFWPKIEKPPGWIFTVARLKLGKYRRRAAWEVAADLSSGALHEFELHVHQTRWTSLSGEAAEYRFTRETLEALAALSRSQRAAVVLHYIYGRSYKDIAYILGCEPNTVGPHRTRGVKKLREAYSRENVSMGFVGLRRQVCICSELPDLFLELTSSEPTLDPQDLAQFRSAVAWLISGPVGP